MTSSSARSKKTVSISPDHCCEMMRENVTHRCEIHPNPFDCPDNLIYFNAQDDRYGIIIHDGTESFVVISGCPLVR
jgi:hypothetical protein